MIFIFDFDSTLVKLETFDELARVSLVNDPEQGTILSNIQNITSQAMTGQLSFHESLQQRFNQLSLHRHHIDTVSELIKNNITASIARNKLFFKTHAEQIYIISGGFEEIIQPVAKILGIAPDHVFANRFIYNYQGKILGIDSPNPLAHDNGKVIVTQHIQKNLNHPSKDIIIIGDGYTDAQIKTSGAASTFYCFTEVTHRPNVAALADKVISHLEELLADFIPASPTTQNIKKALLLENIHPNVTAALEAQGYQVENIKSSLPEAELMTKIKNIAILGIRSKTKVTAAVLNSPEANNLISIGTFCIGTNQIDLSTCSTRGVAVFNAPFSNTRSVVELALGEIIMLMRRAVEANKALHAGNWQKRADGCFEVRGKTLGIIGYGKIGTQLSILAENLGMNVCYYDIEEKLPLGNAKACDTLRILCAQSDIITLHTDGRAANHHLINQDVFTHMKPGVLLINLSRGNIVDIDALAAAIQSGKVAGAAIDVFPEEPNENGPGFNSILCGLPNVILTPHIGGSTQEAQLNIGEFVSARLKEYIHTGSTLYSVNFPHLQLPSHHNDTQTLHRIIHVHQNVPGILAQINHIFAKYNLNIEGQYLKTHEHLGYVITDVNHLDHENILSELEAISHTIRVRVLN